MNRTNEAVYLRPIMKLSHLICIVISQIKSSISAMNFFDFLKTQLKQQSDSQRKQANQSYSFFGRTSKVTRFRSHHERSSLWWTRSR